MRLELAQAIAERLIARFADSDQGFIAGSVRRRKPEPRDIELILPHYPTDDDPVYRRVAAMCEVSGDLFDTDAREEPSWFKVERGLRPGFRHAQLLCLASSDDRWHRTGARTGHPVPDFKVDVFRFDLPDAPGTPGGNLGWVLLQRTGPARFSEACLTHFKRRGGGGSRDGYLIDADGEPIPTRTEIDAFRVLGIAWVEPEKRMGHGSVHAQERWHDPLPEEAIPF